MSDKFCIINVGQETFLAEIVYENLGIPNFTYKTCKAVEKFLQMNNHAKGSKI